MKFLFDYKERDVDYSSFSYGAYFALSAVFTAEIILLDNLLYALPAIIALFIAKRYHSKIKIKR